MPGHPNRVIDGSCPQPLDTDNPYTHTPQSRQVEGSHSPSVKVRDAGPPAAAGTAPWLGAVRVPRVSTGVFSSPGLSSGSGRRQWPGADTGQACPAHMGTVPSSTHRCSNTSQAPLVSAPPGFQHPGQKTVSPLGEGGFPPLVPPFPESLPYSEVGVSSWLVYPEVRP